MAASPSSSKRWRRPSRAWVRATPTMYRSLRKEFQEKGNADALAKARALVEANARLTVADRDRLFGFLEGTGISILPEPEVLLTATPKVPGLGRTQDVEVLRQHHRPARGPRFDRQEAQGHADRSGARAAHRSRAIRTSARCGICTRCIRMPRPRHGCSRDAAPQASVAWNARRR